MMPKRGRRGNRNAPSQWFSKAKTIRRESEGRRGGASITLLGKAAIINAERETYRDENSWC